MGAHSRCCGHATRPHPRRRPPRPAVPQRDPLTQDPYEAEDLVQDTYEQILRRPRELKGDSELHYLRAALRRRHIDRHREAARRLSCVGLDHAPEPRSRAGEDPSLRAEQAEVLAAIRALPEIHRDVLVATYVAGLTHAEAADALGCKRGTIMSRVYRGREALVKSLDGHKVAT